MKYFKIFSLVFLFSLSPLSNKKARTPAQEIPIDQSSLGWFVTFEDEFDDSYKAVARGADPKCFSQKPKCAKNFEWDASDCDSKYDYQLRDLNKCVWKVYDFYNYMDFDTELGKGVNAFSPDKVKIENGKLILSADRSDIPVNNLNCKNKFIDPKYGFEAHTKDCGVFSGGIDSRGWKDWITNKEMGFAQTYGRFEVIGKLSKGQGTWPAFWLLPKEGERDDLPHGTKGKCGWPFSGELDIVETWSDGFEDVQSGYISGYCDESLDVRKSNRKNIPGSTTGFHSYALEWDQYSVCFYIDDDLNFCTYKDEKLKTKNRETGKYQFRKEGAIIPDYAFYWILNLSIERGLGKGKVPVNLDTFSHQELVVDSVRTYRRCTIEDPKEKCIQIKTRGGGVDRYQSTKNETAFAEINAYPNPVARIQQDPMVTVRLRLEQYCQDVKIDLISLAGQQVTINSPEGNGQYYLYDGPLDANEDLYRRMYITHLAAGLYIIRAEYRKCGMGGGGEGNQVFKIVVI
jgi:hypothetical protein